VRDARLAPTQPTPAPLLDRDALTRAWIAAEPRLLATARRLVRDPEVARDVVQDAFVQALVHHERFRGEASLSTWLHRIVLNAAGMWLRRERVRARTREGYVCNAELFEALPCPESQLDARRSTRAAVLALRRLPPAQREVMHYCVVGDLPYERLAAQRGERTEAVKTRAFRARKLLRELMRSA
jgi:RNA polymerase sigma-70 factor (ECF subfamily)